MKDIIQSIGDARAVYGRVESRIKASGAVVRDGRITGRADKCDKDGRLVQAGYARLTGEAIMSEGLSTAEKLAVDIVNAANIIERIAGVRFASMAGLQVKLDAALARITELETLVATLSPATLVPVTQDANVPESMPVKAPRKAAAVKAA